MRRFFVFVLFVLFLTACSNVQKREELTQAEKENLIVLVEDIKNELEVGRVELLSKSLAPSMRANLIRDELQNIDFSKVNIFNSKPQFFEDRARNVVGFNIQNETFYYDIEYLLKKGVWQIIKFKERRG